MQDVEGLRVAEKVGDADQQVAKEGIQLARVVLHVAQILIQLLDLVQGHAPLDAADEGILFVLGEIVAGAGAQHGADLF